MSLTRSLPPAAAHWLKEQLEPQGESALERLVEQRAVAGQAGEERDDDLEAPSLDESGVASEDEDDKDETHALYAELASAVCRMTSAADALGDHARVRGVARRWLCKLEAAPTHLGIHPREIAQQVRQRRDQLFEEHALPALSLSLFSKGALSLSLLSRSTRSRFMCEPS